MKECRYYIENNGCYIEENIHIGTEDKLAVMEKYVTAWIPKVINYKKDDEYYFSGIVFIDAMANSGLYLNKNNEEVFGTSLRVVKKFEMCKSIYSDRSFTIELNDINKQAIECQKCRIGYDVKDNITVNTSTLDVSDYLRNLTNNRSVFRNKHTLLFYDPYNADIRWDHIADLMNEIKKMRKSSFDLIITHFYQNDPKRTLKSNIKNPDVINRYENTYGLSYSEMISELDGLDGLEQNIWFRDRIIYMIEKTLGIGLSNIAYAPVFNSNNNAVYDIVFASYSIKAKSLFKISMHKQMKDKFVKDVHQLVLDFGEDTYESNKSIFTEGEIFYSVNNYAREIARHFSNYSNVSNDELKRFLEIHVYIPPEGVKTEIDKILRESYDVVIAREDGKKVYKFPEYKNLLKK